MKVIKPFVAGKLVAAKFSACLLLVASDVATLRATQLCCTAFVPIALADLWPSCVWMIAWTDPLHIQYSGFQPQDSSHGWRLCWDKTLIMHTHTHKKNLRSSKLLASSKSTTHTRDHIEGGARAFLQNRFDVTRPLHPALSGKGSG